MSIPTSEIVELSKLYGNFKKNYGYLLGAYLYLRSISAVKGRSYFWNGIILAGFSAGAAWLGKHGWMPPLLP